MLVPMGDILESAKAKGYAVVAPNVINEDTARVCIEAAAEKRSSMILDFAYVFHPDIFSLGRIIRMLAQEVSVPVALNLDHGATFEQAMEAIRAGFSSVMVDRSSVPFEQNIEETAEIVRIAHAVNVSVEAELGHVGDASAYEEERDAGLTDPKEAREYVTRTGVDCLAVAVGTAHGTYSGTPHIDLERLSAIRKEVSVPLVLHGGSGTGDEDLCRAIENGVTKINIATDLFEAARKGAWEEGPSYMIYHRMRESYKQKLIHYMELFGQVGRG